MFIKAMTSESNDVGECILTCSLLFRFAIKSSIEIKHALPKCSYCDVFSEKLQI